ncbi:hypothetical protein GGR56DRAFT_325864 [Xylariaceae sp. FL0804]|nr:hypothetical protein GGR56DRAFT_325864 [Xylariaceae sp. FL0804]
MSSPADPPRESKPKKGVGRVLQRVKTVLRRGESSKKGAASGPSQATAPAPAPAEGVVSSTPAAPVEKYPGATKVPRIQVHEERAKKLGAKFGLEIKPSEWHSTEGDVLRVDKAVRMRIHRECHQCHTRFGTGNQCPNCQHTRCKECTRHPVKRTEEQKKANRERRDALLQKHRDMAPIIPGYDFSEKVVLTRSRKGGQDLVYKGRPRMRVRRTCHVCDNVISAHSKEARTCDNCGHRRCNDCPRKPKKYPYGYPNDEPGPNFKGVFACHECKKKFPMNAEDGTDCPNCSHKKCSECPRVKPRKVDPEPDPEILESRK